MQKSKAFKRLPNTHTHTKKKSRFGLTKGAGQCFIFGTVCVGRQLVGRDGLFLGSALGPSSS